MKYLVKVTEKYCHTYVVEANCLEDAETIATEINEEKDLVNTIDDYDETDIEAREVTNENIDWYERMN